jgi:hypothetical protein
VIDIIRAAVELQAVCEARAWRYCFIGGVAVLRWSEPRETVDVDLTLVTGFGGEEPYIAERTGAFEPCISNAARFAMDLWVAKSPSVSGPPFRNLHAEWRQPGRAILEPPLVAFE